MLNYQEVFTKVVTALLAQNAKSQSPHASKYMCMYRGADGMKCAIGHLIPDDKYCEVLEGCGVITLQKNYSVVPHCDNTDREMDFLARLQMIHDTCEVSTWHERLNDMASDHGLEMPC